MVIIDAIFLVVGLGFLARVFFDLCVYALPTAAGIYALLAAYYTGAGVLGSLLIGLITGGLTLSAGQIAFARAQSPALRIGIRLLYAIPAFLVGYQATLDLSNHAGPSEVWRQVFAVIGAIFVGCTAFLRIAQMPDTAETNILVCAVQSLKEIWPGPRTPGLSPLPDQCEIRSDASGPNSIPIQQRA
jgi:hypothetical protein